MQEINTKLLKSALSIDEHKLICKSLDIPVYSENNSQIVYYTGDKNKNALDGSPKLYFYKQTKTYFGYTASRAYDIIGLVQARLALLNRLCSFGDSVKYILQVTGRDTTEIQRVSKPNICDWQSGLEKYVRIRNGESILKTYDDGFLNDFPNFLPKEWLDEGISVETAIKYGLKYYERTNQALIPCRNENGELIGIRCRNFNPQRIEQAKYIPLTLLDGTSYAFPTNNVFYGINYNKPKIEESGTVILVEGEKSVLKADTFMGAESNVLALYGINIGNRRALQLLRMGVNRVVLALDSDFHAVGDKKYYEFEKKILGLSKLFKGRCTVEVVYNNIRLENWYKCSPFDGTAEQWNMLYENREVVE